MILLDAPPAWVFRLLGDATADDSAAPIRVHRGAAATLLTAVIPGASMLPPDALRDLVAGAYESIAAEVAAERRHAIRLWNFVPALHEIVAPGLDRYMVFNAGRHIAYTRKYADEAAFIRAVPTATGVGSMRRDLTIHCLAADAPGRPIEHARQVPAYRYSAKFGPRPPAFARATLVALPDREPSLLVGGTASVRGEESMHVGRLDAQIDEALLNLASIVSAADESPQGRPESVDGRLAQFSDLRVYLPRIHDAEHVLAALRPRFTGVADIEAVHAELCRAELLVEIEGVVRMRRRRSQA